MRVELQPDLGVTLASGVSRQKEGAGQREARGSLVETAPRLLSHVHSRLCHPGSVLLSLPKTAALVLGSWAHPVQVWHTKSWHREPYPQPCSALRSLQ